MTKYLPNNWERIRFHYDVLMPEIMEAAAGEYGVSPYAWEECVGMIHMTPIERLMWGDIREYGLVMYPQFPALNYFLDFANPVAKVAIECDGRDFHDPRKDAERDARLAELGWTVYRISGSDIYIESKDDEDGNSQPNISQLLCSMLAEKYRISPRYREHATSGRMVNLADLVAPSMMKWQSRMERAAAIRASGKYRLYD